MKRRPDGLPWTDTININCRISRQLHDDIKLLLMDPVTGQARPRGWSQVIEAGMRAWLTQQQLSSQRAEGPSLPS